VLSDPETKALLSDRAAFKLFAAEQYLINGFFAYENKQKIWLQYTNK
jgi:hypothetical protein